MVDDARRHRIRFRYSGSPPRRPVARRCGRHGHPQHRQRLDRRAPAGLDRRGPATIRDLRHQRPPRHDLARRSSTGAVSQPSATTRGAPRAAVPAGYTPFRFQGSWTTHSTDLVLGRHPLVCARPSGAFCQRGLAPGRARDPDSRHLYAYGQGEPVGVGPGWTVSGTSFGQAICSRVSLGEGYGAPSTGPSSTTQIGVRNQLFDLPRLS